MCFSNSIIKAIQGTFIKVTKNLENRQESWLYLWLYLLLFVHVFHSLYNIETCWKLEFSWFRFYCCYKSLVQNSWNLFRLENDTQCIEIYCHHCWKSCVLNCHSAMFLPYTENVYIWLIFAYLFAKFTKIRKSSRRLWKLLIPDNVLQKNRFWNRFLFRNLTMYYLKRISFDFLEI